MDRPANKGPADIARRRNARRKGQLPPPPPWRPFQIFRNRTFASIADVLERSREIAPLVPIDQQVLDFLHRHTRCTGLSRAEWEFELRVANAINHSTLRWLPSAFEEAHALVDPQSRASLLERMRAEPGALFITYHGGLTPLRRSLFTELFPNGIILGVEGKNAYTMPEGAAALLAGREALLAGNRCRGISQARPA